MVKVIKKMYYCEKKMRVYFILFIVIVFSSCTTILVNNQLHKKTTQRQVLGSIGMEKRVGTKNHFSVFAVPIYKKSIPILASVAYFDNSKFRSFQKANKMQLGENKIEFHDSLDIKPYFIELQLLDKLDLLESLNQSENDAEREYLFNNEKASVVTNISVIFSPEKMQEIIKSKDVYLFQNKTKSFDLEIVSNDGSVEQIPIKKGVVFGYKNLYVCWKQGKKQKVEMIDLVELNQKCPKKSFKQGRRAEIELDYFDF